MMQAVRAPFTDRFGQAPAVDVLKPHQHAPGHPRERLPGLGAGEAAGHRGQQAPERPVVARVVYPWPKRPPRSDVASHHVMMKAAALVTRPPPSSR